MDMDNTEKIIVRMVLQTPQLEGLSQSLVDLVQGLVGLHKAGVTVECETEKSPLEEHEIFEPEHNGHSNGVARPWGNTKNMTGHLRAALATLFEPGEEFRAAEVYPRLPKEAKPKSPSILSSMLSNMLKSGFLVRHKPGVYARA